MAEEAGQMQRQRQGKRGAARGDQAEGGTERRQPRGEAMLSETLRPALGGGQQPTPHQQFPADNGEGRDQRRAQRRRPPAGSIPKAREEDKPEQREQDLGEQAEAEIDRARGRAAPG